MAIFYVKYIFAVVRGMIMNKRKSANITATVLIALLIVCGGSFFAVKTLNKNTAVATTTKPVTQITAPASTSEPTSATEYFSFHIPTSSSPETTTKRKPETTTDKTESTTKHKVETTTQKVTETTTNEEIETTERQTSPALDQQAITTSPSGDVDLDEVNEALFPDGVLGFQYNPKEDYYFTADDPWQRNFGFNAAYDTGAAFAFMYYDTMRCKFTYDNKDWMIQFWKGQYGLVFIGSEIGVYNKPIDRDAEHYDCANDEDSLMMSMTTYRKGKEIFTREYDKYWWCTGFVPGKLDKFSDRSELSMNVRITLKDYKMLLSFCGALKENDMELERDYITDGLDVYLVW